MHALDLLRFFHSFFFLSLFSLDSCTSFGKLDGSSVQASVFSVFRRRQGFFLKEAVFDGDTGADWIALVSLMLNLFVGVQ